MFNLSLAMSPTHTEAELQEYVEIQTSSDSEPKTFKVPSMLLKYYAPNFAKIFAHPSVQTVKLKGVSAHTLDIFLGWLGTQYAQYGGLFWPDPNDAVSTILRGHGLEWFDTKGDPIISRHITSNTLWRNAEAAIEMYIFAKTYNIPRLRQDAMDRLVWCNDTAYDFPEYGTFVSGTAIQCAYENTQPGNPLRQWLIGAFTVFPGSDVAGLIDLPQRYLVDVAANYKLKDLQGGEKRALSGGWFGPSCCLHEHESEEEKSKCEIKVNMDREIEFEGIGLA